MATEELRKKTRIGDLAGLLRLDIAERSLRSGDHYLTAAAAGEMLGVSSAMANRAMNLLANDDILVRHRSRGTFVGPGFDNGAEKTSTVAHLLEMKDGGGTSDTKTGAILLGLRKAIPDARLVCHFFPANNSTRQIHDEVQRLADDESFGGLILSACRRDIQEFVAGIGIPAVLWGSAYPGVDLPYVDLDQTEIGRLMAKQAVEAGCRRIVFVTREIWREGDTLAFHGITESAHESGLGHDAVRLQNVPETAADAVMQSILEPLIRRAQSESDEPTAFLCRSTAIARRVHEVGQLCDAWEPGQMTILFNGDSRDDSALSSYTSFKSSVSMEDSFAILGRMLSEQTQRDPRKPASVKLPVACVNQGDKQ